MFYFDTIFCAHNHKIIPGITQMECGVWKLNVRQTKQLSFHQLKMPFTITSKYKDLPADVF